MLYRPIRTGRPKGFRELQAKMNEMWERVSGVKAGGMGRSLTATAVALAVAAYIGRMVGRTASTTASIAGGLVIGGALGNVVDRLFRGSGWMRGSVVDFIDFQWFPIFNVADMAVNVGGALFVIWSLVSASKAPA